VLLGRQKPRGRDTSSLFLILPISKILWFSFLLKTFFFIDQMSKYKKQSLNVKLNLLSRITKGLNDGGWGSLISELGLILK
jgi:hypothetical protein